MLKVTNLTARFVLVVEKNTSLPKQMVAHSIYIHTVLPCVFLILAAMGASCFFARDGRRGECGGREARAHNQLLILKRGVFVFLSCSPN